MENHAEARTPFEWESHYLSLLQKEINEAWARINNQPGLYSHTSQQQWNSISQMRSLRARLDEWEVTHTWFKQRNLNRFSQYITAARIDLDKCIVTSTETYNMMVQAEKRDLDIMRQSQKDIMDIQRKMFEDQQRAYQERNEAWRKSMFGDSHY